MVTNPKKFHYLERFNTNTEANQIKLSGFKPDKQSEKVIAWNKIFLEKM